MIAITDDIGQIGTPSRPSLIEVVQEFLANSLRRAKSAYEAGEYIEKRISVCITSGDHATVPHLYRTHVTLTRAAVFWTERAKTWAEIFRVLAENEARRTTQPASPAPAASTLST